MTRVGIITQARMTSTRLPGKVLLPASGKSMLAHHVERLAQSKLPVIVATTTNATDDPLATASHALGVDVFRGSESDVLARFVGAVQEHDLDVVVRVTSDCPLIDGSVVQAGVQQFLDAEQPQLFLSNTLERSYPRGFDFEIMGADLLREAERSANSPHQREHVTPWIYESPDTTIVQVARSDDASDLRVTLDTEDDLRLIRTLIEQHKAENLSGEEIIRLLRQHPELAALNTHVAQKSVHD